MHILYLDPRFHLDCTPLGHTVTCMELDTYVTPLESLLATLKTPPDCIIQNESLLRRRFISGLEHAPCPTFFSTCDTHLNLFWQQYYGRLFDAVLTPHPSLFAGLPEGRAHPQVFSFPHSGSPRVWQPHAERRHGLTFCGRQTNERPLRTWMLELLTHNFPLHIAEDISQDAMMALYDDTRIIPNEALCFELNFRLFEAASAGAVALTPDCGPEQEAAFADGTEILIYHGGLDLLEKTSWLTQNPRKAERIGRAAWERVQREHLPAHRTEELINLVPRTRRDRATGGETAIFAWLTHLERTKSGDAMHPLSLLMAQSEKLPQTPEVLAGVAHLLTFSARRVQGLEYCATLLAANLGAESSLCNATASALALFHNDFELARKFFIRNFLLTPTARPFIPESPFALCLAWAKTERQAGRGVRPGFFFQPERGHLPACAFEFLLFADHIAKKAGETNPRIDTAAQKNILLAAYPAYAAHRLELLAREVTYHTDSWRLEFEAGKQALFCYRVSEGLAHIARARRKAALHKESKAFARALAGSPSHAYIAAALDRLP